MKHVIRIFIALVIFNKVYSDNVYLMNGYVIRNVRLVERNDSIMILQGRDVLILSPYSLFYSRDIEDIKSDKPFKYDLYSRGQNDAYINEHIISDNLSRDNILVQTINGESIDGKFLFSTDSLISFQTSYGIVRIERFLIVSPKSFDSERANQNNSLKNIVVVFLLNGRSIQGEFISSTDSTASYQSNIGIVTIKKNDILSIKPLSNDLFSHVPKADSPRHPNKILVKEYDSLPLLIFTIAGVAGAIAWFGDASDYSDAETVLRGLGLTNAADDASSKSSEKLWLGVGSSVAAIVFLVLAVTPTETYIEQPVTVIPTLNGLRVAVHF